MPTVVAGDFNTWRGSGEPAVALLRQSFPQSPAMPPLPTWRGPFRIHAQLDYVFLRGLFATAAVTRLPSVFGSDHYPMLTLVRF
jgi:endonuclease/exonuclease/phosphatase family metal-dependent hydrolase